ncbi:helix-turn-helix domain-containing protein [Nocardia callitridis]|uniref:Helix-turn-helix transcriptional regulator n=1 Tax=Nocardia callitridis TaxID=648753 RepID=A0ABP9JXB5_9NOCA
MSEDGSTLARRQLGKYLRNGRDECGFTIQQVAELIERSASTLQRIEKGTAVRIRTIDLEALCKIYGFGPEQLRAMKGLATQGSEQSWWCEYGDAVPTNFDFYVELEASARQLTSYEPEFVPGLLQTPAYTGVLIRTANPTDNTEEHMRRVQLRTRRQLRIARKHHPVILDVIVRESVLRGLVGSPKIMATQLRYLAEASTRPNVNVQVLPFSAGFPVADPIGPFVIMEFGMSKQGQMVEPPVVYTERSTGGLYFAKPAALEHYHQSYESLRRSAMDAVDSRALLRKVAKEYA